MKQLKNIIKNHQRKKNGERLLTLLRELSRRMTPKVQARESTELINVIDFLPIDIDLTQPGQMVPLEQVKHCLQNHSEQVPTLIAAINYAFEHWDERPVDQKYTEEDRNEVDYATLGYLTRFAGALRIEEVTPYLERIIQWTQMPKGETAAPKGNAINSAIAALRDIQGVIPQVPQKSPAAPWVALARLRSATEPREIIHHLRALMQTMESDPERPENTLVVGQMMEVLWQIPEAPRKIIIEELKKAR